MRQRATAGRKEYRVESPGQQDRKETNDTIKNEKRDRRGGRRQESEGKEKK